MSNKRIFVDDYLDTLSYSYMKKAAFKAICGIKTWRTLSQWEEIRLDFESNMWQYPENEETVVEERPFIFNFVYTKEQIDSFLLDKKGGTGTAKGAEVFNDLTSNKASGIYSHAEGVQTVSSGLFAHAEGQETTSSGQGSHAEGVQTVSSDIGSHAEGVNTQALSQASHAQGSNTIADGLSSHAEGVNTTSSGLGSHSEGGGTVSSNMYSHAEGQSTQATAMFAHAEGNSSKATEMASHAEGSETVASGRFAHAEGQSTTAQEQASHAEGGNTKAFGMYSHAEGQNTLARSLASHAEGVYTNAIEQASHTEGQGTTTKGYASHAEGLSTLSEGAGAHAEGIYSVSEYTGAHSEGNSTFSGKYSFLSKGGSKIVSNTYDSITIAYNPDIKVGDMIAIARFEDKVIVVKQISHTGQTKTLIKFDNTSLLRTNNFVGVNYSVIRKEPVVSGGGSTALEKVQNLSSHSEGSCNIAYGNATHAEGAYNIARGEYSHAEGSYNDASGESSHSEGSETIASGMHSHSQGYKTEASAFATHAGGFNTKASTPYSTVIGLSNVRDTTTSGETPTFDTSHNLLVIGNGTVKADVLSNAFRVDGTGKVYAASTLNSAGADYAEYFEWLDNNPDNEDRIGRFVTLDGNKIKLASSEDSFILGVISGTASVLGDSHEDQWSSMYLKDDFGRFIREEQEITVPVMKQSTKTRKHSITMLDPVTEKSSKKSVPVEESILVEENITVTQVINKVNPDYDASLQYIPRSKREEWDAVGMLGKIIVKDDGTCEVNGYCYSGEDGVATKSKTGYRVIERISENIIKIVFR